MFCFVWLMLLILGVYLKIQFPLTKTYFARSTVHGTQYNAGMTFLSPVWKCWCICSRCPLCGSVTFVHPVFTPVHRYPPGGLILKFIILYFSFRSSQSVNVIVVQKWKYDFCYLWGKYSRRLLNTCSKIFLSCTSRYFQMAVYSLALWSYSLLHLLTDQYEKVNIQHIKTCLGRKPCLDLVIQQYKTVD